MRVGIIQCAEGVNRTKRQKETGFTPSLSHEIHPLLPWDMGAPGSWAFGLRLGLKPQPPNS